MKQHESIETIVAALRQRKRALNAVNLGLRGMFYGSLLALAGVLASLASGALAGWQVWWLLAAAPGGVLLGMLAGAAWPIDPLQLARALDAAADSDDRFASAMQLAGHHRQQRVSLIAHDALTAVCHADARQALPMRCPMEARWLPLVLCLFVAGASLRPGTTVGAADVAPEVSAEQWQELQAELRRQIDRDLEEGELPEEDEAVKQLKRLAESLSKHPDKKAVLAEVARLRSKLNRQREQLRTRDVNLRRASQALTSSEHLRKLAALLKQGRYAEAAQELKRLAAEIDEGKLSLSAEQLEAISADFERLAEKLKPLDDMHQACQQCASAASSFDVEQLAESLDQLSRQLEQDSDDLKRNDAYCRACDALDEFERRLAQSNANKQCPVCQGKDSQGCAACQGGQQGEQRLVQGRGQRKGGLKPGTQTAGNWLGGKLGDQEIGRVPDVVPDREQGGPQTVVSQAISKDEDVDSALQFKQKFAEFVQQAEADLELEEVPVAYRDFLRRYFSAIKPEEQAPASESAD